MNYKALNIQIKSLSYKLLLSYQIDIFDTKKDLQNNKQTLFEFLIVKIDLDITQNRKKYPKSNIYTNIGQYKSLFKKP